MPNLGNGLKINTFTAAHVLEKFVIDSAIQLNNLLSDSYSNIKKVFMENPFPFSDGERPLIRGDIYYMNKKGEMVTGDQLIIDNGK